MALARLDELDEGESERFVRFLLVLAINSPSLWSAGYADGWACLPS